MEAKAIFPARRCALQVLVLVIQQGKNLDQAMQGIIEKQANMKDKPFIQALVYGVLRDYYWLEAAQLSLLAKPLKAKEYEIKMLIMLGLYELKAMKTPPYAVINEVVSLCKVLNKPWATKLVNAILRRFSREQETFSLASSSKESQYNHPLWLIKQIQQDWPVHWQAILAANMTHPPMHLRVNLAKTNQNEYLRALKDQGIVAMASTLLSAAITLEAPVDICQLPHFKEGQVSVQDLGAQMAAGFLDLLPKMSVLDACAAPGGKTCHILESEPGVSLTSLEINAKRLARVQENLDRLEVHARLLEADANEVGDWWDGQTFDRILLDVPCSATGVIRRHPDILLLRQEKDIASLQQAQLTLLSKIWQTLKPGGILLYATCSVLYAENDAVIEKFLASCKQASVVDLSSHKAKKTIYGLQFLPEQSSTDGFYYAKLIKVDA